MWTGTKIFGVPFDPPNSPERLNLKRAYITHLLRTSKASEGFRDPYDALRSYLLERAGTLSPGVWQGKMHTDSWLTPKPDTDDLDLMIPSRMDAFFASNGCWEYALKVSRFVEEQILPDRPVMIGVDHSLSGGVVRSLAGKHRNLNVVVLDAHVDTMSHGQAGPTTGGFCNRNHAGLYHCGNFLGALVRQEVIKAENLWILGVEKAALNGKTDACRTFDSSGEAHRPAGAVHVYNRDQVLSGIGKLSFTGPIYASVDMDVGSLCSVFSARFMNCQGLDQERILDLLRLVKRSMEAAGEPLVGMDIMEIDVHMLEAADTLPVEDCTRLIAREALDILLS